ncbi:MAG: hypothetical protein COZ11_13970 [Deltaproteobacteria bacterium CG_4_10_14_3_um_filter_51_14]|nr:MAG: hypothetical protein COZ11_13970 [Deltaproteobacteria bacterium CG_4_10_14_3_um_filter_51_14]
MGNEGLSRAVTEAIAAVDKDLLWVALGGTGSETAKQIANDAGIRVVFEAFPDRAYTPEGKLAPRTLPGALIKDPAKAAQQALLMAVEGKVTALDGSTITLAAQTLCVHGDNPSALELVRAIRSTLEGAGIKLMPIGA